MSIDRDIRALPALVDGLVKELNDARLREQWTAQVLKEARQTITDLRAELEIERMVNQALLEESEAMRHPNVIPMPSRRAA